MIKGRLKPYGISDGLLTLWHNDLNDGRKNGQNHLLHGLHMHSWVMRPLAYLLEQEGFEVALFDYYSVLHSMNRHVEDLARMD